MERKRQRDSRDREKEKEGRREEGREIKRGREKHYNGAIWVGVDSGRKGEKEGGGILRRHLSKAKELGINRTLAMGKIWEHISNEILSNLRVFGKGK